MFCPGHRGILNTYAHDRCIFFPWEEAEAWQISRDAETLLSQQYLKVFFFWYSFLLLPLLSFSLSFECFFLTSGGFIQCPVGGYVETHQLSLYSCIIYESTALMSYHAFLAATLRFSSQCSALFYILVILIDPFLHLPFSNIQQLRC